MLNDMYYDEFCQRPDQHEHNHKGISLHIHGDSIVVSGHREIQGVLKKIKNKLTQEIEMLGEWIVEQKGVIAHLKAYTESSGLLLSDSSGDWKGKEVMNVHVNIVAIIYYIDIVEIECRIAQVFDNL